MGTAYIETCITAEIRGVTLFQIECVAEVNYEVDAGALSDWRIHDFRFEEYRGEFDSKGCVKRVKTAETWCPDILRPTLLEYVDKDKLESDLIDQLIASGEMYNADRRSHYAEVA